MEDEEAAIRLVYYNFLKFYNLGDVEGVLGTLSPLNATMIGTGKGEVHIGGERVSQGIQEFVDYLIENDAKGNLVYEVFLERFKFESLEIRGDIAWFIVLVQPPPTVTVMSSFYENMRISAVLEKIQKEWKISQLHASLPDARLLEGEMIPSNAGMQTIIETWLEGFDGIIDLSSKYKINKLREYLQKAQEIMASSK